MRIRLAAPADRAAIEGIVHEAYAVYVPRIGHRPAPMGVDYAALIVDGVCFVADDDEVLGVIVIYEVDDYLLIENVAVSPKAQGRGVGREMLDFAETAAQNAGLNEVRLYTNEAMSENLAYYPRRGYVEIERRAQDGFNRVFFVKKLQ